MYVIRKEDIDGQKVVSVHIRAQEEKCLKITFSSGGSRRTLLLCGLGKVTLLLRGTE